MSDGIRIDNGSADITIVNCTVTSTNVTRDSWHRFDAFIDALVYPKFGTRWHFELDRTIRYGAPILRIRIRTIEAAGEQAGQPAVLSHMFELPPWDGMRDCPFSDSDIAVWFLQRIMDVHRHEAMEMMEVEGETPFFPDHAFRKAYRMPLSRNPLINALRLD